MSMGMPSSKRHMSDEFWSTGFFLPHEQSLFDSRMSFETDDDAWNLALWPVEPLSLQELSSLDVNVDVDGPSVSRSSRKRAYEEHEPEQSQPPNDNAVLALSVQPPAESSNCLVTHFPQFNPSLPSQSLRQGAVMILNPFEEVATCRHHTLRAPVKLKDGKANSYVKLQLKAPESQAIQLQQQSVVEALNYRYRPYRLPHSGPSQRNASIPGLPAGFGRTFRTNPTDAKLLRFYIHAMCTGRTVLSETNGWLNDLAPMAESDAMMRHAILAFAAGYVLDLWPTHDLLERANDHYRKACALLSERLATNPFEIGKEDALVGCIRVLWCDDIVQWELRRNKNQIPRWFLGVQQGKKIMATTDPGFRYYRPKNVQCSSARMSNANMMAFVHLIANLVRPLSVEETAGDNLHPWLLECTEKESRRVYGGTGLCPKLLHMFGQITHLCARMYEDDTSTIIPRGAEVIAQKLINFHQWSQLSDGHASPEALLQSCRLDENGLVSTPREVTELSAEAWVQTARIYLQIRLFRLPRTHPHVQQPFQLLCSMLERLPSSGPLFTSQTPFFPFFLAGLVATTPDDRQIASSWFETVVGRAGARSNVPPIWRILQETWTWIDQELVEDDMDDIDQKPIGQRLPWWETMVDRWMEREGLLSLV